MIKDHIVGSLNIEKEDFDSVPFKPEGGLEKAYHEDLYSIMDELLVCAHAGGSWAGRNEVLAA